MGRVTFNGNVATSESQAYIRAKEIEIYNRGGDEYQMAREVEMLYRENGLEPGTMLRAGHDAVDREDSSDGLNLKGIGLILIAVAVLHLMGFFK